MALGLVFLVVAEGEAAEEAEAAEAEVILTRLNFGFVIPVIDEENKKG